jgi:hypothetical protein
MVAGHGGGPLGPPVEIGALAGAGSYRPWIGKHAGATCRDRRASREPEEPGMVAGHGGGPLGPHGDREEGVRRGQGDNCRGLTFAPLASPRGPKGGGVGGGRGMVAGGSGATNDLPRCYQPLTLLSSIV